MSDGGPPRGSKADLVAELDRRENALEAAGEIISRTDQPFHKQVESLLTVVREAVGTEFATFSYVNAGDYLFEVVDVPDDVELQAGDSVPVSQFPNCRHVAESAQSLVLEDVQEQAPELADPSWGISCYLGAPVFDDDGVYGTFCFYGMEPRDESFSDWDVTFVELLSNWVSVQLKQREREQTLRDAKLQMEAAVEAGAVGTWEWDIPNDEMVTNPSFARTFGVDPDAAQEGVSLDEFVSAIHREDRDRVEASIEEAIESCGEYREEYRVWDENFELTWVIARGHVECDKDGNPQTFPGALIDITDRKNTEQELKELNEQLRASNERLEQFAYAASHDLQEPLRMVSSYLQLIESRYTDALDEEGEEFLEYAVNGADRMREMIDGILAYSRVESQGAPFGSVDLNDVMEEVQRNLEHQITQTDAEITVTELPTVDGDVNQLQQLFQNLMDNAHQYSGEEPPAVEISAEREGDSWVVAVQDEGIGIAADDQERIFEVFERLHSREQHPGTGIGLSLCKRIVERHGGDIWVDSEPGEGTTFFVSFPAPGP